MSAGRARRVPTQLRGFAGGQILACVEGTTWTTWKRTAWSGLHGKDGKNCVDLKGPRGPHGKDRVDHMERTAWTTRKGPRGPHGKDRVTWKGPCGPARIKHEILLFSTSSREVGGSGRQPPSVQITRTFGQRLGNV